MFCINAIIFVINSDLICFDNFCPNQGQPYSSYGGIIIGKKKPKTKLLYKQINMKKNNSTRPHKKRTTKNIWCYANGCGTPRYSICLYFSNKRKVFIWLLSLSPNQLLDKTMLLGKPSKLISQCYLVNSDCLHWFVFQIIPGFFYWRLP